MTKSEWVQTSDKDIEVSTRTGHFRASKILKDALDDPRTYETMSQCKGAIDRKLTAQKQTKRNKLKGVRVFVVDSYRTRRRNVAMQFAPGEATGIHRGTGNVMFKKDSDVTAKQYRTYSYGSELLMDHPWVRRMAKLQWILNQRISPAVSQWLRRHTVNGRGSIPSDEAHATAVKEEQERYDTMIKEPIEESIPAELVDLIRHLNVDDYDVNG